MPELITPELYNAFKESLVYIFVKDYLDIEHGNDCILISYEEYKFHSNAAYKLYEICTSFGLIYWVLVDPKVIKIKITRKPHEKTDLDLGVSLN